MNILVAIHTGSCCYGHGPSRKLFGNLFSISSDNGSVALKYPIKVHGCNAYRLKLKVSVKPFAMNIETRFYRLLSIVFCVYILIKPFSVAIKRKSIYGRRASINSSTRVPLSKNVWCSALVTLHTIFLVSLSCAV